MADWADPSRVDPSLDSRAVTFENPSGERGAGGRAHGGRKGAPSRQLTPGEMVVLADLDGPGTARHLWMTFPPAPPEVMRAAWLEVFYDGRDEPSVSVPCLDFFALPHGRPVAYASALTSAHEGRGFNAYFPMPFRHHLRIELTNGSARPLRLYYQLDVTLERELPADAGYLHVSFRRENPTEMRRDFVIADGMAGPGRFVGCAVGVRVLDDGLWYGEGEVKVYRDGDRDLPTICGTGLEDYVGSAWGLGSHQTSYMGAPLVVRDPATPDGNPDFVGFYRWHVLDPVMFARDLRVSIQQIGFEAFLHGQEDELASKEPAGGGWLTIRDHDTFIAAGIAERVDDYCATAFIMCAEPQAVPRVTPQLALADIARKPYEAASRDEASPLVDAIERAMGR